MVNYLFYVYNEGKWIETEKIYPHDIVLILNVIEKSIYLWIGNRSTKNLKLKALESYGNLISKFPNFKFQETESSIPIEIQLEIDKKLDLSFEQTKKIDRTPDLFLFLVLGIISIISILISVGFMINPLFWQKSIEYKGYFLIKESNYAIWINNAKISLIISIILFEILLFDSIFSRKIFLIMTSFISSLISIGFYKYISLNIYLFDLNPGLVSGSYSIMESEIYWYLFLIILGLIVILIPMGISIKAIITDTIPISFKEWKIKRKRSKITLEKFSIITHETSFINKQGKSNPNELIPPEVLIEEKNKTKEKEVKIDLKPLD